MHILVTLVWNKSWIFHTCICFLSALFISIFIRIKSPFWIFLFSVLHFCPTDYITIIKNYKIKSWISGLRYLNNLYTKSSLNNVICFHSSNVSFVKTQMAEKQKTKRFLTYVKNLFVLFLDLKSTRNISVQFWITLYIYSLNWDKWITQKRRSLKKNILEESLFYIQEEQYNNILSCGILLQMKLWFSDDTCKEASYSVMLEMIMNCHWASLCLFVSK